jgi:hypothetical protein
LPPLIGDQFHRFITSSSTPKGPCGNDSPAHRRQDDLTLRCKDTWSLVDH